MSLDAIAGIQSVAATGYVGGTSATEGTGGAGFATSLASAIDGAQQLQSESKTLAVQAVTGDLTDIHNATIAATRAQVTLELVSAVRNKGVDAFNDIMRMQA